MFKEWGVLFRIFWLRGEYRGNGSCLMGTNFQFCKMRRILEVDGGDVCIMWMYLILNCTLKNKMVNFVTCILSQWKSELNGSLFQKASWPTFWLHKYRRLNIIVCILAVWESLFLMQFSFSRTRKGRMCFGPRTCLRRSWFLYIAVPSCDLHSAPKCVGRKIIGIPINWVLIYLCLRFYIKRSATWGCI